MAQWDNDKPRPKSKKSSQKKPVKKKPVKKKPNPKKVAKKMEPKPIRSESKTWDYAAVPVGGLVGFGLGHVMQKRYVDNYGYVFTALDGAIVVFGVLGVFASCVDGDTSCEEDKDDIEKSATGIWWASRLTQAYLLTKFIRKHQYADAMKRPNFQFALLPTKRGGLKSQFAWNF